MESDCMLVGSEIHGFRSMADLDVLTMMEEAKERWLRPNEIFAILCNHKYFTTHVKPINLPRSGIIVLFDRKMLRNFRKDGHNWKKKKNGKTVKEAHEHLKVGNVDRIHVYYAHGEDNPTFVRRCYWLLDKSLEHIVLVHYRETQKDSPAKPGNSNSRRPLSEESDSAVDLMSCRISRSPLENHDSMTVKDHEQRLHEINTLEWDELLIPDDSDKQSTRREGKAAGFEPINQYSMCNYQSTDQVNGLATNIVSPESSVDSFCGHVSVTNPMMTLTPASGHLAGDNSSNNLFNGTLQARDSFGRWMNYILANSPGSVDEAMKPLLCTENQSFASSVMDNHHSQPDQIFKITEVSPLWALSTEETKILVTGFFIGRQPRNADTILSLACGDSVLCVEVVQVGVFRSIIPPRTPGLVNLYLSIDGHKPISQVLTFEFRAPIIPNRNEKYKWEEFQLQMRLARLLFSSSRKLSMLSTELSQGSLKEAKAFALRTSHVSKGWAYLTKMIEDTKMPFLQAKDSLFELMLQNRLQKWLLEKVATGSNIAEHDEQGQGVIHLCAILGYTWALLPFLWSGLSIDYRDKYGWTALHWAAYYGREKMVAALLSVGAKPNFVTHPTPENPGGYTAADLASKMGFDGLAGYLAEKSLVAQFNDMSLAGNVTGTLQTASDNSINHGNFSEKEWYLKDTLAAIRTAADIAARIQAAFREHSLKVWSKVVVSSSPEMEARSIVAAIKIQHAFRHYETCKKLAAAARIQCSFCTWKTRKNFLNMRRQAIKIQAVYRGYLDRKQYTKIVWSVGILEKAILRWRQKRNGFRGLQVKSDETIKDSNQENDVEEEFFRDSRKQAEDRIQRSFVKVQAMFRSKQAQEEYGRMKLEHNNATLEYEDL